MPNGPAYRIVTENLELRCLEPADATQLCDVIAENVQHLRPWIEWAREGPRTLDSTVEVVRRMRGRFDLGESFAYAISRRDGGPMIGGCALAPMLGEASASIGYWLARASTGQGLASEAAAALVRVAFEIESVELIEISCVPDNVRSAGVAERLGFHADGTQRKRLRSEDGVREDRSSWSMLREEYPRAPAARVSITAYDAIGRTLIEPASGLRRGSAFR